ncbi:MAG: tRNA (adenosine(37)-N6)-threonylcarbamoyltransferase complex ATPase subunit type 1 TsaE [candidate division SR1 bacterium]|nr:MAG: tRNA (adenosine(37)-N6)-threonylcarbamoyltransferase complex ATPase subunit type 1 TsaE [candidate division SR1 bacterium]
MRISSPEAMHQLGRDLAQKANVLLLSGELGAGKTTLIKGFAEALGIDPEKVQSPTYAYLNLYDGKLLHIDMYRLGSFDELVEKGILSQIAECEWVVIEWPKWVDQLDLEAPLQLEIEKISASEREVKGV